MALNDAVALQNTEFACGVPFTISSDTYQQSKSNDKNQVLNVIYLNKRV
jgi:hypothetical protein